MTLDRSILFRKKKKDFIDLGISMCKWLRDDITRAKLQRFTSVFCYP